MIHFSSLLARVPLRGAGIALALFATSCASEPTRGAIDNDREVQDDDLEDEDDDGDGDAPAVRKGAAAADAAARAPRSDAGSDAGSARAALPDGSTPRPAAPTPDASTPRPAAPAPDASTPAPAAPAPDAGQSAIVPELEALRQECVDEINRYRATLSLQPLARASDREECSDKGAQLDGDSGRAHGSAGAGGSRGSNGYCPNSAQNTCPGWGVGGRSGNATVAAALKGCLKMMWNERPPPPGRCTGACYQAHGHSLT